MVMVHNQMVMVQVDTPNNKVTRQQATVTGCKTNKHLKSHRLEEMPILT